MKSKHHGTVDSSSYAHHQKNVLIKNALKVCHICIIYLSLSYLIMRVKKTSFFLAGNVSHSFFFSLFIEVQEIIFIIQLQFLIATGVCGSAGTAAAQHAGPGYRSGGGGVTVSPLYRGAGTALALQPRRKTATISNVQVGDFVHQ